MRISLGFLPVLLAACGMLALAVEPASAPATRPAATRPAPSWASPKEAYLTFVRAYVAQDGLLLSKSVAWEDPSDEARVKALKPLGEASNFEVFELLTKQFPEDKMIASMVANAHAAIKAGKDLATKALTETEQRLATAEVVVHGESATIKMRPIIGRSDRDSIGLKKVADTWRVLPEFVGAPYAPPNAAMRAEMNKSQRMQVRVQELMAESHKAFMKDLRAKKFATAQEALTAMQKGAEDALKKIYAEEKMNIR